MQLLCTTGGKVLEGDRKLSEYGINDLSTLELSGRLHGGMRKRPTNVLAAAATATGGSGIAGLASAARLPKTAATNRNAVSKFNEVFSATYATTDVKDFKGLCVFYVAERTRLAALPHGELEATSLREAAQQAEALKEASEAAAAASA